MPFKVQTFRENVDRWVEGAARDELARACQAYAALTTPQQKTRGIQEMMVVLDRSIDEPARWAIMEACGRACISASTLQKARHLQKEAQNLDDLLDRLNQVHTCGERERSSMQPMIAATADRSAKHANLSRSPTAIVPVAGTGSSSRPCYASQSKSNCSVLSSKAMNAASS
jgi:hypothetical protein